MKRLKGIAKAKYTLIIIASLCLMCMLNSCGTIIRNIGYGQSESEVEKQYRNTESMYNAILDGKLENSQKNWNTVIKRFNDIIEHHPKSQVADDAQYSLGLCYIWSNGQQKSSLNKAIKAFDKLTYYYPQSELVPNAYYWRAYAYSISGDYKRAILEYERFLMKFPKSDLFDEAEYQINECRAKINVDKKPLVSEDSKVSEQKTDYQKIEVEKEKTRDVKQPKTSPTNIEPSKIVPPTPKKVLNKSSDEQIPSKEKKYPKENRLSVDKIRFHSSQEYTRVVIDLSQSAKYDKIRLDNPDRLCINIKNAMISMSSQNIDVDDKVIKSIRASQFDMDTVRLVIDLKTIKNYKIFSLKDPFRIVVDIFGRDSLPLPNSAPKSTDPKITIFNNKEPLKPVKPRNQSPTLVKQLGLKVKTIAIDPGHGGKDPGAVSKYGLYEKNFVLDIAQRLRKLLKATGSYEVYMTRETDIFIPLEERTDFANRVGADVFLSIHINSSTSTDARGIETYYLSLASDEESRLTAALENASSERGIRDLGTLIGRMLRGTKINESRTLAQTIQPNLCQITRNSDRGVKRAPFIVLIGANAPSILVELGFMSNTQDEVLLKSEEYKDKLAKALMNGIEDYIKTMNPSD
jgi:N-acetylmuramoyl-L-alanine amidase